MLIGFDAKRFFHNFTGLGNYSRFVVDALSRHVPGNDYLLFSPRLRHHPEVDPILERPNVRAIGPRSFFFRALGSAWRSWGVSREPEVRGLSIYHGLSQELPFGLPGAVKKVVTVHDLIFLRFPELYNPIDVRIYRAKVARACEAADLVIAISRQTADDVTAFLGTDRGKISVVYQGCHPSFRRRMDESRLQQIRQRYALPRHYILCVGTVEPRKNAMLLVEALAALPESSRVPVVFVGRATAYKEAVVKRATELGVVRSIRFAHDVTFGDLPGVYQLASLFVYPSRFEGFGIPLVEAIESGLPVISSTGSCFSEAAGPASLYVDPGDGVALAEAISRTINDQELRRTMAMESFAYVQRFRPERIAADLTRVYRGLMR